MNCNIFLILLFIIIIILLCDNTETFEKSILTNKLIIVQNEKYIIIHIKYPKGGSKIYKIYKNKLNFNY